MNFFFFSLRIALSDVRPQTHEMCPSFDVFIVHTTKCVFLGKKKVQWLCHLNGIVFRYDDDDGHSNEVVKHVVSFLLLIILSH